MTLILFLFLIACHSSERGDITAQVYIPFLEIEPYEHIPQAETEYNTEEYLPQVQYEEEPDEDFSYEYETEYDIHTVEEYYSLDVPVFSTIPQDIQNPAFDPNIPMIALTFDDGPSDYTGLILDILYRHGARATFCVVGRAANARQSVLVRIVEYGSEVVGHSWNHRRFSDIDANEVTWQIRDTSNLIYRVTGQRPPRLMRPPYGDLNDTARLAAENLGYGFLLWSIDPRDWEFRDAEQVYHNIMSQVRASAIIVLHDTRETTAEAMKMVVPSLIEQGFQLVTASELIAHHYGNIVPGQSYRGR